jgi:hypothetical protein
MLQVAVPGASGMLTALGHRTRCVMCFCEAINLKETETGTGTETESKERY